MKKQYTFYFDSNLCSGCKTCQIACKDKNNLDAGVLWRRVYEAGSGNWINRNGAWLNNIKVYNMSISCNHCQEPICVELCPTKAMNKNESGIVKVDTDKCIGCRYCEWACPYGAPQFDEKKGIMSKCNFCADYIEEGKNPSCVDACPMRVLDFGEVDEMRNKYGDQNNFFPLPESSFTKPAITITPHKNAFPPDYSSAEVLNKEEV